MAISIVQGGPGFPVLLPALYQYFCTGECTNLPIEDCDVPHHEAKKLLMQV